MTQLFCIKLYFFNHFNIYETEVKSTPKTSNIHAWAIPKWQRCNFLWLLQTKKFDFEV